MHRKECSKPFISLHSVHHELPIRAWDYRSPSLFPAFLRLRRQGLRLGGHLIAAAVMTLSGNRGWGGCKRCLLEVNPPLRSEKLDLRLTPGAMQTLQRAAAVAKRSVTDFVLESALASAAETLTDRQSFQLDP